MSYMSPPLGSPSSTLSTQTSQYFPLRDIAESDRATPFNSSYYRQHSLFSKGITVNDDLLSEEEWSRHAFAMGMPSRDVHRSHPDARRFTQRLQRRAQISDKHITQLLLPLIQSALPSPKKFQVKTDGTFHPDAVPSGRSPGRLSGSSSPSWSLPLPVPEPNITIGFGSQNFTEHQLELQDGIISDAHGEPCNLAKVSQPVAGNNMLFWPFFTVHIQKDSLEAAQNASAGSGATCSNALGLLAEAAEEPIIQVYGRSVFWQSRRQVQTFSLSVHNDSEGNGKMATLNIHTSQGGLSHTCAPIRSYALCNEYDVECLLSRLGSIFIWAENSHMQNVFTLLSNLDALVQLESGRRHLSDGFPSPQLDAATGFGALSPARSKFGVIKDVLAQVSPKWIRV